MMKGISVVGRRRHEVVSAQTEIASLYDRLVAVQDPKASISPLLNQWTDEEGHKLTRYHLQSLVRAMKDFKRFDHALEKSQRFLWRVESIMISKWMTDCQRFQLTPSDLATRLDLISIVHGQEQAENYFSKIPKAFKTPGAYGALLSGYVREKSVEKADATMQKMRKKGFARSSFSYNMLINLYSHTDNYDKIEPLVQEMQRKGIPCDKFTVNNLMAAYVLASDISAMEKLLQRMKEDPHISVGWNTYSAAASGYLKVGLIDKALEMIKKMEMCTPVLERPSAFKFLLSLYASAGRKEELYRVWNQYKPSYKEHPEAYICMITSLGKLDDIEGAEKVFQEWESGRTIYDIRILNQLLTAYCKKCLFDKAESLVASKAKEGRTISPKTWNILAMGYMKDKQMPKAVEMLRKAISVGMKGWVPDSIILESCLDYLAAQGDLEKMEEIVRLCKNLGIPVSRTSAPDENGGLICCGNKT